MYCVSLRYLPFVCMDGKQTTQHAIFEINVAAKKLLWTEKWAECLAYLNFDTFLYKLQCHRDCTTKDRGAWTLYCQRVSNMV
jgi:hypothetical protein